MKVALIGPGKLGNILFHAAAGERLVVGRSPGNLQKFRHEAELGVTTRLERASQCQIAAVAIPAEDCKELFSVLCPLMPAESILLNFATNWDIPRELSDRFPRLHLVNAKVIGSAVGMSHGLNGLILLDSTQEEIIRQVQTCLPGLHIMAGNSGLVKQINTSATRAALTAALSLEQELDRQGIPSELIQAAVGCLMPGVLIAYEGNALGAFAKQIVQELKQASEP